ncbi:MAG: helix-turn-helix transcriptional regulator [bacterium]|nr:helix-turn-helix transcriptional regulator [bacterium]
MHYGNRLKYIRENERLSQTELAEKFTKEVSQANISYWENSKFPPLEMIVEICSLLNYPLSKFFDAADLPEDQAKMLDLYLQLTPEQKEIIEKLIESII